MTWMNRALLVSLVASASAPLLSSCGSTGSDTSDNGACSNGTCSPGAGGVSAGGTGATTGGNGGSGAGHGGASVGGSAGKSGGSGAGGGGQSGSGGKGAGGGSGAGGAAGHAGTAGGSGATGVGGGGHAGTGAGGKGGTAGAGGAAGGSAGSGGGQGGQGGNSMVFPALPIIDGNAPLGSGSLFPPIGSDPPGGPCLLEPEDDALFPRNWLRPRFHYAPPGGENLFEIRLTAPGQTNALVVYTDNTSWTMPLSLWTKVGIDLVDVPLTVTVRGGTLANGVLTGVNAGSTYTFRVAPADATGTVVYWTTTGGSSLKGFAVAQEDVTLVLQPNQVEMTTAGGAQVTCIGCHTSTPDGKYAAFTAQAPWADVLASVQPTSVGKKPDFLGSAATTTLGMGPLGIETFSKAHWSAGDHVEIAPIGDGSNHLAWFDLEATDPSIDKGYGYLKRDGDGRGAGAPTWSHDGSTIVYVSTNASVTGRLDNGDADLFAVPYNDRMGGTAQGVPGASDSGVEEYYPSYSGDDQLLAFNVIPNGTNMYDAVPAEVWVIPSSGGTKQRLKANDPPACSGKKSPGVTNSWPKWSPEVGLANGKRYYWMIFSSKRDESANPQLYMSAVVVSGGVTETHGAVYLWNQPATENNHTPAWDVFDIKP